MNMKDWQNTNRMEVFLKIGKIGVCLNFYKKDSARRKYLNPGGKERAWGKSQHTSVNILRPLVLIGPCYIWSTLHCIARAAMDSMKRNDYNCIPINVTKVIIYWVWQEDNDTMENEGGCTIPQWKEAFGNTSHLVKSFFCDGLMVGIFLLLVSLAYTQHKSKVILITFRSFM
jgi:hypothetical protein